VTGPAVSLAAVVGAHVALAGLALATDRWSRRRAEAGGRRAPAIGVWDVPG